MVGIYANVQMMRIFQKNPEQSLSRKLFTSINITQDDKVLSIYSLSSWPIASYSINMVRWAIWYHMYNLKNVKNIHGGLLILVKLQAEVCNFTKINTPPWVFFTFFKLYKCYQNHATHHKWRRLSFFWSIESSKLEVFFSKQHKGKEECG